MSEAEAAGGAAAPAPAPADDLFDGLFRDLPAARAQPAAVKKEETAQPLKRKQPGEGEEASPAANEEGQKRPKGEEESKTVVELGAALAKISGALRSSKVEKFRKAAELLLKLLMADMDADNRAHFHSALGSFMEDEGSWDRLIGTVEDRALSERVFKEVQARILLFSPEEQYRAATWVLLGGIRPRLFTDDSYEFRRAVKELREYVRFLQAASDEETAADRERRRAVLACLGTALKRGLLFAWAKPSVEEVFALATERRLVAFPEGDREALDEMATQLRAAKHGQSVNPNASGASSSVVSRSVRLANSMSTPWNRKDGDIFR